MRMFNRHRGKAALAAVAASALALSACSGDGDDQEAATNEDGKKVLTLRIFQDFGYEALVAEYNDMQDDVEVVMEGQGTNFDAEHRPAVETALEAGTSPGDVIGMDEQAMAQMMVRSDWWADLAEHGYDSRASEYPDWKWELGHTVDGGLAGFGTDVGGMGLCYRADLFEEAGLPTDRAELAAAWSDWDGFTDLAQQFVDSDVDADFVDSPTQLQNMILGQTAGQGDGQMYVDADGNLTLESAAVQNAVETILELNEIGAIGQWAAWSEEWTAAHAEGGFAVASCPSWMVGLVEDWAGEDNAGNWDFAAAPGVSGNWGGSWLLVPANTPYPEEAAELAAWLTAPEQQVKAFEAVGAFPSTLEGAAEASSLTNPYFNDAPVGEIIAGSVAEFPALEYAELHHPVKQAVEGVLNGLLDGTYSSDEVWDAIQTEAENAAALGGM
ncbi:extracellular solute-binding protein [Glycomyces sp. L485]|uniref:ABC transporter substrate-binding protein n=1 Tax=Glycomyces sp. L485 TaxID=2909235 RepID=UPI001F4A5ABA|nr:extracellular solute-binding protein [Glycomyces sp. L485]MCH7231845.1 extracellular solute-binding protein [Glycomyces sp. L485]